MSIICEGLPCLRGHLDSSSWGSTAGEKRDKQFSLCQCCGSIQRRFYCRPHSIQPGSKISAFLRRDVNKVFAEVEGAKVNRGAGYGLEVPCTYRYMDLRSCNIDRKELVDSLLAAGLT